VKGSPDGSRFTAWALVGQLGLTMAASIVFGILLGLWLDGIAGTRPLFTLLFSLIGITAGSLAGYRAVASVFAQFDSERAARTAPNRESEPSADAHNTDPSDHDTKPRA
jgi:F0F1-type ATP synthase assembly protein I